MLNRDKVISVISNLSSKYGVDFDTVILFGSVARDEIKEDSDIDLYIESKVLTTDKLGRSRGLNEMQRELYSIFENTEFDIIYCGGIRDTKNMKNTPLWRQINKEGVVVYDK